MNWVLAVLLTAGLVEIALRLPLLASALRIMGTSRKAMAIMRSRAISDHWKEKAMRVYSGRLFSATLMLAVLLIFLSGLIIFVIFLIGGLGIGFGAFAVSWPGMVLSAIAAFGYLKLRHHFV
jgi:hypothetical protein